MAAASGGGGGGGGSSYATELLRRQLIEMGRNPPDGVSVGLVDDANIFSWEVGYRRIALLPSHTCALTTALPHAPCRMAPLPGWEMDCELNSAAAAAAAAAHAAAVGTAHAGGTARYDVRGGVLQGAAGLPAGLPEHAARDDIQIGYVAPERVRGRQGVHLYSPPSGRGCLQRAGNRRGTLEADFGCRANHRVGHVDAFGSQWRITGQHRRWCAVSG